MKLLSFSKLCRISGWLLSPVLILIMLTAASFLTLPSPVARATQDDSPQATQVIFTNPAAIAPADRVSNAAGTNPGLPPSGVYPSNINVSGLSGTITKVTVTFAVTSTFLDDFDILLVGPTGARSLVMSDAGGSADHTNVTYTFDQTAALMPDNPTVLVPAGTYRPSNYAGLAAPEPGGMDNFPAPGPGVMSYPTDFNIFNGTNPNGTWSLFVVDDQVIDVMSLPSGWSINITVAMPTGTPTSRACDFDGDNKTDPAVIRVSPPTSLTWLIRNSMSGTQTNQSWGSITDFFVPHDYDGDGKTDIAIWRPGSPGVWYILRSTTSTLQAIVFGQTGDDPSVVDDYNNDGRADPAVVRNVGTQKIWFVLNSQISPPTLGGDGGFGNVTVQQWGTDDDFVAPGDYDGDGRADYAVQRAEGVAPNKATFYLLMSTNGAFARPWGQITDLIAPGDYDGDGKTDIAVVQPQSGNLFWWVVLSNGGQILGEQWGLSSDFIVQGDYDGDSKTDLAVWRPGTGTFHVKQSAGGVLNFQWGTGADAPPATYNVH